MHIAGTSKRYFFLGIVAQEDLLKGIFEPSYILCQSHGSSEKRSGWRVNKVDGGFINNILLVSSIEDRADMIDFLSSYRTRDHHHKDEKYSIEETRKYYPKGALFWFLCNEYGERAGPALFIHRVPILSANIEIDSGKKRIESGKYNIDTSINGILARRHKTMDLDESNVKIKLVQRRSD